MAEVKIMVGGRQYSVHCRDGEEARLHQLAGMMSEHVNTVKAGAGLTEVRQLLFAGLLLADSLSETNAELRRARETASAAPPARESAEPLAPPPPEDDPEVLATLTRLAERIEALGDSLAAQLPSA